MIIIKIQGGLGNQLIQYSFGKVISLLYQKEVAYDLSFFNTETKYTKRPYLLDQFNTTVRIATDDEIKQVRFPYFFSKGLWVLKKILQKYVFRRYAIGYNHNLLSTIHKNDSLYLEGYWQSYKYYQKYSDQLSFDIELKDPSHCDEIKNQLGLDTKNNSVAVHIRRGDLLKTTTQGISVLDIEYYKQAIRYIEKKVEHPQFYIFSDDALWVKQNIVPLVNHAVVMADYALRDCEEFILMKVCKHAIIANSTFSWFSVLLQDTRDKVIVYPLDWKNQYLQNDKNICPPHWAGI